jgi:hypothetical protein
MLFWMIFDLFFEKIEKHEMKKIKKLIQISLGAIIILFILFIITNTILHLLEGFFELGNFNCY